MRILVIIYLFLILNLGLQSQNEVPHEQKKEKKFFISVGTYSFINSFDGNGWIDKPVFQANIVFKAKYKLNEKWWGGIDFVRIDYYSLPSPIVRKYRSMRNVPIAVRRNVDRSNFLYTDLETPWKGLITEGRIFQFVGFNIGKFTQIKDYSFGYNFHVNYMFRSSSIIIFNLPPYNTYYSGFQHAGPGLGVSYSVHKPIYKSVNLGWSGLFNYFFFLFTDRHHNPSYLGRDYSALTMNTISIDFIF
jgi:hypothetical protein